MEYLFLFLAVIMTAIQAHSFEMEDDRRFLREMSVDDPTFHGCNGQHLSYLPGTSEMQSGYDFVEDKVTMDGSHLEVLDTFSTDKYNLTIKFNGQCYKIPDAYVSGNNIGVLFDSYASTIMESTGSKSAAEERFERSKKKTSELGLEVSGYEGSIGASYSMSSSTSKTRSNTLNTSYDSAQSTYSFYSYGLQIKNPVPSKRIVHVWKDLYNRMKTAEDPYPIFANYFDVHGTHYFTNGMVGGEWTVGYNVERYSKTKSSSSSQGRSDCLGAKLSASYLAFSGSLTSKYCSEQFKDEHASSSFESLTTNSWSICRGGASTCPNGPGFDAEPAAALEKWKKGVKTDPTLIKGTKRWITHLMDFVMQFSDFGNSSSYAERLNQFGETNSLSENKKKLQEFRDATHTHLQRFIEEKQYCKIFPTDPWCGDCHDKCWEERALSYDPNTKQCTCEPKPTEKPMTDSDCEWSYTRHQCEPTDRCKNKYKFGDIRLSQSCRVK